MYYVSLPRSPLPKTLRIRLILPAIIESRSERRSSVGGKNTAISAGQVLDGQKPREVFNLTNIGEFFGFSKIFKENQKCTLQVGFSA